MAKEKGFRTNLQIRLPEAMIIDEQKGKLGILKIPDALELARQKELDLVEVSPNLNPPVCKIMDYGKYLYIVSKQKRKQSTKQKKIETKGIRLSIRTEKHDLEFKAKNSVKFMLKDHRVKIDMILRGREKAHAEFAREKFDNFLQIIYGISEEELKDEKREIVKLQEVKKTPQGLNVIIQYKINK